MSQLPSSAEEQNKSPYRYRKDLSASDKTTVLGLIKSIHSDAIEFTLRAPGMDGMIMLFGLMASALCFGLAYDLVASISPSAKGGFVTYFGFTASSVLTLSGLFCAIKSVRLELFRPEDQPTIFDRKNRKVYRIYQHNQGGWRTLLRRWPMKTVEYDWDLIDAEHEIAVTTTGSSVTRLHALIFKVRRSGDDPTIVGEFSIGNSLGMGETTVPALWEHIRRFMEEDGPHLPPGEEIREIDKPRTLWECMTASGAYGSRFRLWWREHPVMMSFGLLFLPVVVPFLALLGICSWLGHKTSFPVEWPARLRVAFAS